MTELPMDGAPPIARTTDSETSHAAAQALTSRGAVAGHVLRAFAEAGAQGCTASEVARMVPAQGSWKRISDCERLGWVRDAGYSRMGESGRLQTVRVITDAGRAVLAQVAVPPAYHRTHLWEATTPAVVRVGAWWIARGRHHDGFCKFDALNMTADEAAREAQRLLPTISDDMVRAMYAMLPHRTEDGR